MNFLLLLRVLAASGVLQKIKEHYTSPETQKVCKKKIGKHLTFLIGLAILLLEAYIMMAGNPL